MAKIITSPSNWPTPELATKAAQLLEWRFGTYPKALQDQIAHQRMTNNPGSELEKFLDEAREDTVRFSEENPKITASGVVYFSFE